jgi:putative ABC transport system permease protein
MANFIAWPIAYFAINAWLQNFAYRIGIGWWRFALAGGLALLIALATVSTQAIKVALANPVGALRYE